LSASKDGEDVTLTFPGKVTGSSRKRQRLYKVRLSTKTGQLRVSRVPSSYLPDNGCAEAHDERLEEKSLTIKETSLIRAKEAVRVITLKAYTDPEWQARYGSSSSSEIANAVNVAETIYNRQLGIRFNVVSITHLGQSFPSNEAGVLLNDFRLHPLTQETANIQTLFTGKDMAGSTAGIAYIGVICYSPQFSFNVVQSYGSLTGGIFAHEVGHNMGATHDTQTPNSLMYPFISYSTTGFSQRSLGEITTHLSYYGSCLSSEMATPSLYGSTLTITKKKKGVSIQLLSARGTPLDDTELFVTVNKKTSVKVTNANGLVVVPIRIKGKVTVEATVTSLDSVTKRVRLRF
jgi:hypothetical protein